jgi:cell division protein ZapE
MPPRTLKVPRDGLIEAFAAAFAARGSEADAAQQAAVHRLQAFYDELIAFKVARRSKLRKLLVHPALPKGIWFWGGVGRGKSFLMDSFFAAVPYTRKRRVHFHAFMREIHERLRALKNEADPLAKVAVQVAKETRLMCFDEFHVADIADAMILARLMQALFDAGVLFCITSNYPPDGLYPDGLQRERLLPTIRLLNERLDVIKVDAGIDYRLRALQQAAVYLLPSAGDAARLMMHTFSQLVHGAGHAYPIKVLGRDIAVVHRAPGIAWFDFAVLCGGPRSQNDYLDIAQRFHTVFVSSVPCMGVEQANAARRFTWLVDICYDHRVKLVLAADVPAEELYVAGPHAGEFARTVSRLIEMRSEDYLASAHKI